MALSSTALPLGNPSGDGDSTTALVQVLMTFRGKKLLLMSNLNLSWCNPRPLPFIPSLAAGEKSPTPTSIHPSFFQQVAESQVVSPQPYFLPQRRKPIWPLAFFNPMHTFASLMSLATGSSCELGAPHLNWIYPHHVVKGKGPTASHAATWDENPAKRKAPG